MFVARVGNHGEGHRSRFKRNIEARNTWDWNDGHVHSIAYDLEDAKLGNSLVGIELILCDLSKKNRSLDIGIGTEGETRRATDDHFTMIGVEAIALLALEKHVEGWSRPRTTAGSDAQESALVPSLEIEEVKVDSTGGAGE